MNYRKLISCKLKILITLLCSHEAVISYDATNWNGDTVTLNIVCHAHVQWVLHDCVAVAMIVEVMHE
jgi:hypothetical protein